MLLSKHGKKTPYKRQRRLGPNKDSGLRTSLIPSAPTTPLAHRQKATLKYQTVVSLNPAAFGIAQYSFSANGLFDPDISGVGHQPRGFDQLMLLYDHYTCICTSFQATFFNGDSNNAIVCGLGVADQATTYTTLNNGMESPDFVYAICGPRLSGSDVRTLRRSINPNRWLGSGTAVLSNDQLRGSAAANPAEQAFFNILVSPMDEATDVTAATVQVLINYTVIFTEPKNPGQS